MFWILLPIVLVLQLLHRRLLAQVLPERWKRWIPAGLGLLHLPLVAYMLLRLSGWADNGLGLYLRLPARWGLAFQLFTLVNLLIWLMARLLWHLRRYMAYAEDLDDPSRRAFLRKAVAGGGGLLLAGGAAGMVQAFGDPEITRTELHFHDLPEGLEGLRIVHLTDLHAGPLVSLERLRHWRLLAERERPDILAITGDLVDSQPQELASFVEAFQGFSAPLGRFAILGNHDYFTDPRPIWSDLERMGIQCLENRHVLVEHRGARLVVLGLQDPMARRGGFRGLRFGPGPMPQDVALQLPSNAWRMALCHRPSNWNLARETGARLTLAGHTHGGQINLIPGVSSALLLGPFTQGVYRREGQTLYVSRGLGTVGLPARIAAAPEIAVLTLRRQEIPSLHPDRDQVA